MEEAEFLSPVIFWCLENEIQHLWKWGAMGSTFTGRYGDLGLNFTFSIALDFGSGHPGFQFSSL